MILFLLGVRLPACLPAWPCFNLVAALLEQTDKDDNNNNEQNNEAAIIIKPSSADGRAFVGTQRLAAATSTSKDNAPRWAPKCVSKRPWSHYKKALLKADLEVVAQKSFYPHASFSRERVTFINRNNNNDLHFDLLAGRGEEWNRKKKMQTRHLNWSGDSSFGGARHVSRCEEGGECSSREREKETMKERRNLI